MEQTECANKYENQQRVSFLNFIVELPNFVAVLISAIASGSLLVWMDFIDSLCNITDTGFVTLLYSIKSKRAAEASSRMLNFIQHSNALPLTPLNLCSSLFAGYSEVTGQCGIFHL